MAQATPPAPNSSDDYLVSRTVYDPRLSSGGPIVDSIDNAGRISETQMDLAGRTVRTIQNFGNGTVEETDTAQDITTDYQFDSSGRMVTMTAYNAKGTGNGVQTQATKYLYQSPVNASLQTAVVYADSTDTLSQNATTKVWTISSGTDHTSATFDLQGRPLTSTDQRGVVHTYLYDTAGRMTDDRVTTLPAGIDGSVRAIVTGYDDVGRVQTLTSYDSAAARNNTNIVNQVRESFDGWGNLAREWQSHTAGQAVDINTTPSVQYTYSDGAVGGVARYVRLSDVIYPNGRDLSYGYGTTGAVDDIMSRLATIGDSGGTLAAYTHLGAGTLASEDYTTPQVKLDYAANSFAAWDRFGRVKDQVWASYGQNPGTRDGYEYTYNRAGDRTSRTNLVDAALSETYGYDSLDRLTSSTRGDGHSQSWGLDGLGNWGSFTNNSTTQTRAADAANQIASINGTSTVSDYDLAGNMTTVPDTSNPSTGLQCKYDAWNRLSEVRDNSGNLVAQYQYDGSGRRIVKLVNFSMGVAQQVVHSYLQGQQVVEERSLNSGGAMTGGYQYLWSPRYIDCPIARDTLNSSGQIVTGSRVFYLADANYNVTALVNASGAVIERYYYDAYGAATVCDANFAPHGGNQSAYGNNVLYTGRTLDAETGLFYYRARYYSTSLGTFVGRDRLGLAVDLNPYRYTGNSPVLFTDPSGKTKVVSVRRFWQGEKYSALDREVDNHQYSDLGKLAKRTSRTGTSRYGNEFGFFLVFEIDDCTRKARLFFDESESTETYQDRMTKRVWTEARGTNHNDITGKYDFRWAKFSKSVLGNQNHELMIFFDNPAIPALATNSDNPNAKFLFHTIIQTFIVKDGEGKEIYKLRQTIVQDTLGSVTISPDLGSQITEVTPDMSSFINHNTGDVHLMGTDLNGNSTNDRGVPLGR